jgi:hypothetical protein
MKQSHSEPPSVVGVGRRVYPTIFRAAAQWQKIPLDKPLAEIERELRRIENAQR